MIEINTSLTQAARQRDMGNVVFRCPRTGLNVQHWLVEETGPDAPQCSYETVVCKACMRLHFINRRTGKVLGDTPDETTQPEQRP